MRRKCLGLWTAALFLASATSAAGQSPTAREIVDRAIAAHGGTKLERLKTRHLRGTVKIMGFSGTYEEWAESPNKLKDRIDIGIMAVERAYDGREGWEKRGDNVSPIVGHDLTRRIRHALFSPLLSYGKGDVSFVLEGTETVDDAEDSLAAEHRHRVSEVARAVVEHGKPHEKPVRPDGAPLVPSSDSEPVVEE